MVRGLQGRAIMVEGCGGAELLSSWWPGNGAGNSIREEGVGQTRCQARHPRALFPHLLGISLSNVAEVSGLTVTGYCRVLRKEASHILESWDTVVSLFRSTWFPRGWIFM